MLCDLPTVQQAAVGDCLSFDPFSFDQNGLAAAEVDVSRRQMVPDELGAGLFAHCCEEMSILAGFLPTVYRIHNADTRR